MLEKIKSLKGLFYRKITERKEREAIEVLPGFAIKRARRMVEFPEIKDLTKVNITYPLIEPFAYVNIKWDPEAKELKYYVIEPELTKEEVELLKKISDALIEMVEVELTAIKEKGKVIEYLEEQVAKIIKEYGLRMKPNQYIKIMYYIYRNFVGFNQIEPFLQDPNIEDISCDGIGIPIYVVHRKYGTIKTNVSFDSPEDLREFVIKLAERCGRYVSYAEPILSGTLPDGSLDYNETIIFKEDGLVKLSKIGELVDKFYNGKESNVPIKVGNLEVPAFDQNLKVVWRPVEYVYRHRWDGKLYKIFTETGRSITLTGNHSIFVLGKNKLEIRNADELRIGDYLLIPLRIPSKERLEEINLAKELCEKGYSSRLLLFNVPRYVYSVFREEILDFLKNSYKHPESVFKRIKSNLELPLRLYKLLSVEELKKTKIFEVYHPKIKVDTIFKINEEVMRLLGYYVAEGWLSASGHDYKIILSLGKDETEIIKDVKRCCEKCFGISPYEEYVKGKNEVKVKIVSRLIYSIFKDVFRVKKGARKKRIPQIVLNVRKNLREEFIKAWWRGDYGYTVSKDLASDMLYLLLLNGNVNSVGFRKKKSRIEGRKIKSKTWYFQRLLSRPSINYPYFIPMHVFNSLNKTHMKLKQNKRIGRKRLERILSGMRYKRFENLATPSEEFIKEWEKRGFLKRSRKGFELTMNGVEMLRELNFVKSLISSEIGFVKIKDIKSVDASKKFVYDVSVKGLENFIGGFGGLFCHNSRVAATLAPDVATRGATFTIRKFGEKPFSPIEQIDLGTVSPEILSYFWYAIEHGANILIVGGTATGKCILPQDHIQLANGEIDSIQNVYKRILESNPKPRVELFTLTQNLSLYPVSVNKFWKLESPPLLIKIKTETGCNVTTTPEHEFLCMRNGKIERVRSDRVVRGDYIAAPRKIEVKGKRQKIRLEDWVDERFYLSEPKSLIRDVISKGIKKYGSLAAFARSLGLEYKRVEQWSKGRTSIPLLTLKEICTSLGIKFSEIESRVEKLKCKTASSKHQISPIRETFGGLLKLVGYIIGDGGIYNNGVQFFNNSRELREDFTELARRLGLHTREEFPRGRTPKVVIQNRAFATFLSKIFEIPFGKKSSIVDVPKIVMRCPNQEIKEFIKALFDSDCYVPKKECEIEFSTKSERLAYSLSSLMRRFGIVARIRKKKNSYRVVVSGKENLEKYKNEIGFTDSEKEKSLSEIIEKTKVYHTNVDLIPVGPAIKEIIEKNKLSVRKVARAANLSRRGLGLVLEGKRNPTRRFLIKLIKGLRKFAGYGDIVYLEKLANSNIFWDRIKEVEKIASDEKFVYDFTVDGTHNFVAGNGGGLIVSNTSFLNSLCMFIPPEAKIVCTTKDSNLLLNDRVQRIGNLVEKKLMQEKNDVINRENTLILHLKNPLRVYGWNTQNFNLKKQNIKTVMKLKAPERLVQISTEYGTYVTLTPNTKVPVIQNNRFSFLEAEKVEEGNLIPQISKINLPSHLPRFDPLLFARKHNLRVKVKRELFEKCAKKVGGVNKLIRILNWRPNKLYRKSYKADELIYMVNKVGLKRNIIKEHLTGIGKYKIMLPFSCIPPELFYVAGLIITDGHLPKKRKWLMFEQVKNKKIQRKCTSILSKYFGGSTKENTFYSEPAWYFFNKIFNIPLGKKSRKIRVPGIVMKAPQGHALEFLKGVIDGDGSIRKNVIEIFTTSENFAESLIYLLLRFGIVAKHGRKNTLAKNLHFIIIEGRYFEILVKMLGLEKVKLRYFRKPSDVMLPKEIGLILKRMMRENNISTNLFEDIKKRGILAHVFYDKKRKLIKRNTVKLILNRLREKLPENKELEDLSRIVKSNDIIWTTVKEKKFAQGNEKFVYDITPEETEYFPAGRFGFIIIQDSIEDTREIRIPHEHWIPGLARVGFGIPMPTGEKYGGVTLFDLLKESFRQNPDYVIVGETRGKEAYVMFQGMASGHTSLSTFHAGSLDTVIKRLTTPPIELSPTLIESLNIVAIMVHAKEKGKAARRVKEVVEIESVDPKTGEVKTKVIFRWNPVNDTFERVEESVTIKKLAEARGERYEDALAEIERRKRFLEWVYKKGVKDYLEVTKMINRYYKEPEKVLEEMGEKVEVPFKISAAKPKPVEKPKRRISVLELLGLFRK